MCVGMYMWIQCLRGHRKVLNSLQLELQAAIRHLMLVLRANPGSSTKAVWAPYHWAPYPTDHCALKKNIIPVHSSSLILHCFHLHSQLTPMSGGPGSDSILINKPGWEVSEAEGECFDTALLLWVSCSSVPSSLWIQAGETVPSLNAAVNRRCPWQTSTRGSKALLGNSIHPVCSHFISEGSHKARADVKAWIDDV